MPDASPAISQILPCWFPKLGLPLFLAPLIMAAMRNYAGGRFCLALLHYLLPPRTELQKKKGRCFALLYYIILPTPAKNLLQSFHSPLTHLQRFIFWTIHIFKYAKFETGSFKFLYAAEICSIGFIPINPSTAGCLQRKSDKVTWVCRNLFFQTT